MWGAVPVVDVLHLLNLPISLLLHTKLYIYPGAGGKPSVFTVCLSSRRWRSRIKRRIEGGGGREREQQRHLKLNVAPWWRTWLLQRLLLHSSAALSSCLLKIWFYFCFVLFFKWGINISQHITRQCFIFSWVVNIWGFGERGGADNLWLGSDLCRRLCLEKGECFFCVNDSIVSAEGGK